MGQVTRVLIVDDQPDIGEALTELLGMFPGIDVVGTALDASEGFALIERLSPDVILMDMRMPGMDGIAATREILGRESSAVVIMHSAYGDEALRKDAMSAGAANFVIKGSRPDQIASTIVECGAQKS